MIGWTFPHRLSAPKFVYELGNYPKYEVRQFERRCAIGLPPADTLVGRSCETRVEQHRWRCRHRAGRLGDWPHWRRDHFRPRRRR